MASVDPILADVLRRLRSERGLSIEAVAREAHISYTTLAKIEHAQTGPAWLTVRAIAQALDISMAELGSAIDTGS